MWRLTISPLAAPVSGNFSAISSANYHEDHFGLPFDLRTPDGEIAHSACFGFGLERITLALFATHGMDVANWPAGVRSALGC